jgi:hypothetical protein
MSVVDFAELYPRLYPVIALRSRGRLGDWWIFKSYKAAFKIPNVDYPANPNRFRMGGHPGMIVCKMYYPYNPRTDFQQAWRAVHYASTYNWHRFDQETKNYYNQLTRPKAWDGYRRYLSLYLNAHYPPDY